ncbi:endopeptidase La [Variovorax sp. YR216]|uniref:endopeptidase La n=1 Tax=Variovorax sp. YR216 TaxID=1882828 RepID=UPI00089B8790|nr:endopeptidase La [Variovorax sp. YR216]SEB25627.1 ATP-dependent Lon protease [Variovorax sp. YR216]
MTTEPGLPPSVVALIPMRNFVLFPHALTAISVGRDPSIAALRYALENQIPVGIVLQKDAEEETPAFDSLHAIGTLATIVHHVEPEQGQHHAVCQGMHRFRLVEACGGYPFLAAKIAEIEQDADTSPQAEALELQLRERAIELLSLLPSVPSELVQALQTTRGPSALSDIVAGVIDVEVNEKQELLEMVATVPRVEKLLKLLSHRLEVVRLSREIGERTKEQINDTQRKFLLRQQMETIRHELGEDDANAEELRRIDEAIAKAGMPADAESHARKELQRLRSMSDASSEYAMLRTYLEWMVELPWKSLGMPPIDLAAARATLEADHFGLEFVKKRVLEFLAVRKLNPEGRAPILCFVGPPGVGKTSLGQSIARAIQRPFVRVSLGGVHDEAEIRGHRRTYIGALPGNILQGLRRAGSRDAVMMLDEVDKLSASAHGDPSAALLEVLDPEQNGTFRDNYLGIPFDLSRVVFIATANVIDNVPAPVQDRMEVIELPGYSQEEKLNIARRYLVPRQREANGLKEDQCALTEAAIADMIANRTREAGVRQLEREIGRVMRHAAMRVAEGTTPSVEVDAADLDAVLGPARFEHEAALRRSITGVATGLAWTPVGGDILFIEAARMQGDGKLHLTGQLGDVMKESAQAAFTLVKTRAQSLGIRPEVFDVSDVHLHIPAGAVPKDGPSAGVAMFIALASLFSDRTVRHDVAMTGEISLRGLVLPVGGIKEKVLAAQRAGLSAVLLPARNLRDLSDVPGTVRASLRFVALETVDDAIAGALNPEPSPGT